MPSRVKTLLDYKLVINKLLLGIYYCFLRRKHIYSLNRKIGLLNDHNRLVSNDLGDFEISTDAVNMNSIKQTLLSTRTLCMGAVCGIAGVLIDLDHIPGFLLHTKVSPVYLIPGFYQDAHNMGGGRPFHNLILVLSLCIIMFMLTVLFQYNIRAFAANAVASTKKAITTVIAN